MTMSSTLWLNIGLAVPFLLAFTGVPLWLTLKRPDTAPDHTGARAYLAAKRLRVGAAPAMSARRAA
jgi:hypothetical protein